MSARGWVRALMHCVLQDYRINFVVASHGAIAPLALPAGLTVAAITADDLSRFSSSATAKIVSAMSYERAGLRGLVLRDAQGPQCVAHFAAPAQYDYTSIWPLADGELSLVNIATERLAMGKGYAPLLIQAATAELLGEGASRITAFIWWSNTPSRRAFVKAGWKAIGFSLELKAFGRWWALRIPLR